MNTVCSLPKRKDLLVNQLGYPSEFYLPQLNSIEDEYVNTMYRPVDVTSDWEAYSKFLIAKKPEFSPKVTLVGHDESEIENITLMSLGGVVLHMNGVANYALLGSENIELLSDIVIENNSEWIGFNIYTGFEDYVFKWIKQYKINSAQRIFKRKIGDFEEADSLLKALVKKHKGVVYDNGKLVYAPIIIGGHYNNFSYKDSYDAGADYVVRGKGINLLRDILLGLYDPGIYHDPMPYANIPMMDREGFYRDTFEFSENTQKYAKSKIKSVLTALGCSYSCTYCYIGSLIDNLKEAYADTNIRPPSIIQDRDLDVVLKEGEEIRRLDKIYGVETTAVFDQADISLNNISWWEELSSRWMDTVRIPFYIQARPAMLVGKAGIKRIEVISKYKLVSGISMAIESGDEKIRKLLLDRHENNSIILSAIKNVKSFDIPLRTQAIVGLPVMQPDAFANQDDTPLSLIDKDGIEYYYDDPIQESLKCLELVCKSKSGIEDYYWNAIYSPFPGTPLGDYTRAAGFITEEDAKEAYLFGSESKLSCFDKITVDRQVGFAFTSNFFSHLKNGADMMLLFLYENKQYNLETFSSFIKNNVDFKISKDRASSCAEEADIIKKFIDFAYPEKVDQEFYSININLLYYYINSCDGVVLAAKLASYYFNSKCETKNEFSLYDLYRVERNHYYDACYLMNYIPKEFFSFFEANFSSGFLDKHEVR